MVSGSLRDTLASMTDDDLMALVGPATWANGLRLARRGAVRELTWHSAEDQLETRVTEGGLAYRVRVAQATLRMALTCACPLRSNCPHAAATLIVAREEARERDNGEAEWSRVLRQVVGSSRERAGDPLALIIDAHDSSAPISLTPLRRGAFCEWTGKRASWLDLTATQWVSVTDGIDPTHLSLVREGYRLSRESRSWHSRTEVTLASLGEHAYPWLNRLVRAGVTLFSSPTTDELFEVSHATWDADIDVVSEETGLAVTVVARNGDRVIHSPRIDAATGLLVLDGGRSVARLEGASTLEGFPFDRALRIPSSDVAEFRGTWLPALRRRFVISSADGSFDPRAATQATLVGTVRRDEEGVIVRWWAEYQLGKSRSRAPVAQALSDEAVAALVERVDRWGSACGGELWPHPPEAGRMPPWMAPRFLARVVDQKAPEGLVWDVSDDVRTIEVVDAASRVDLSIERGEADWFDLTARLSVGSHSVSVREALEALGRGDEYVRAGDAWVRLDGERIVALAAALEEARALVGWDGEGLRLSALHVGAVDVVAPAADTVCVSGAWTKRVGALVADPQSEDALAPLPSLGRILRPYQREGHAWLTARLARGFGAILADDMGLGKTIQILSAIAAIRHAKAARTGPILVVAPTSVVAVWMEQAARFAPDLRVRAVTETEARRGTSIDEEVDGADLVITSYTLVRLESDQWTHVELDGVVIDEAQAVKNPRTATYRSLRDLNTPWRLAVSGTPIENSLADLWALLSLTCPGLLPSWEAFNRRIRKPIESGADPAMLARLTSYVAPFILRRTKEQVAQDLPDKVIDVVRVDLGREHRRIYDQHLARARARILDLLADVDANRMSVLSSLTRLRQLALDPALVDGAYSRVGSAKIEYLADHLDEIVPLGHQALVFSQFTSFLARIRGALERHGIAVVQLDGSTRDRDRVIEEFRSGQAQVFLISLKVGGAGLTLTEADYVYVMDPWWNPAAEEQAIDRAHRIGQTKKVNVYRLVAADTIEAKVVELQDRKRRLISSVMNGAAAPAPLSAADLRALID